MTPAPTPAPIAAAHRIEALDVLRGLAIFGILVVNVQQMFLPLVIANDPVPMLPSERWHVAVWAFTDAFFENKFLTVFSLLFGAGFALQQGKGAPGFSVRYLRRLALLAIFGFAHAAFFYMADVLMIYAVTALALLALQRLSTRATGRLGFGLLVATLGWGALISGPDDPRSIEPKYDVADEIERIRTTGKVELPGPPAEERSSKDGKQPSVAHPLPLDGNVAVQVLDGGDDFESAKVEYAVFSRGPVAAATDSRLSFLSRLLLVYLPFYLFWRTLALFLIGAWIVRSGGLDMRHSTLWRRVARVGFGFGLPLTIAATWLHAERFREQGAIFHAVSFGHDVASLLLAAALGATVLLWCRPDVTSRVRNGFAAAGRMALSNYLGQSVVMALVATSYGLGLFGDLSRLQILGLAAGCCLLQLVASTLWLRFARMGPLEWLWRCGTYLRAVPLGRTAAR